MVKEKHILTCVAVSILTVCSAARNNSGCVPSSCGDITISYPFRLRGDEPLNCGHPDPIFLLDCHQNRTVLKAESRRYYVQAITYSNFTARVSLPGLDSNNYSSCPVYSSANELYRSYISVNYDNQVDIAFVNYLKPIDNPLYVESPFCGNTTALSNSSRVYSYAAAGRILVSDLEESCTYDSMTEGSSPSPLKGGNYMYSQIHDMMAYGIELSWHRILCVECEESMGTCTIENNKIRCRHYCYEDTPLSDWTFICKLDYYLPYIMIGVLAIGGIIGVRFLLGIPFLIGLVLNKYKKQGSAADNSDSIEELLRQDQTNPMPINNMYKEIKRMTRNFKVKLAEGIHATVYKGKLKSGPPVAVKMMTNSSVTDKDFISSISVMSKANHPNVVKLIGFCMHGTKQTLVHEFVQCGSLEKHILLQEGMICPLTCGQMFQICLGIAHGLRSLHSVQIYHLGLKPQNILLNEDFNPKISDSLLYSLHDLRVKGKGKMGYVAPEVFYKNIGEVSGKVDVYSFEMLVLEMAARLQSLNPYANKLGKTYFPSWIYKQLIEGKRRKSEKLMKKRRRR